MVDKIATREAYADTLVRLGAEDERIVILDADVAKSSLSCRFGEKYPERFFDLGVAEQNMVGTAAGLATTGLIPFVNTFAVFASQRALDQVSLTVAYANTNVKIAATYAGLSVGQDGATHQSVLDLAIMRAMPNMTVLVPADGPETARATEAAAAFQGPVYLRLGKAPLPVVYEKGFEYQIGRANLLREGRDLTIIACGMMVAEALAAAEQLASQGIEARVVDMHTLKPLDREAVLAAAQETGAIVTAEEHSILGGLGGAIAEVVAETDPVPVKRVGIQDCFGSSAPVEELWEHYGLTANKIITSAYQVLTMKKRGARLVHRRLFPHRE